MVKVAFFVFNTGNGDLRVHRQASLLARNGYQVRIYCFLKPGLPEREERSGYTLIRADQRPALTRFFDDKIARLWKKERVEEPSAPQLHDNWPVDRAALRPCPRPAPRPLPADFGPGEEDYLAYVRRINSIWARLAIAWGPEICQAHDADALMAARDTAAACRAKLIYDAHELWSDQPFIRSQATADYWDRLEAECVPDCDALLSVSHPFAEELGQRWKRSVTPLHNCQEYRPLSRPHGDLRHLSGGKPVALYQGVLGLERGLEEFIASSKFQDQVHLAIRGFGAMRDQLEHMAKDLPNVHILPPCPSAEIVDYATQGDIGIIPFLPDCLNHFLNTPNKLFEYMMAGLPIAAAHLPDLERFVAGNQVGLLFDPYSPSDMARAIVELCNHPELKAMGARAHQLCKDRYNWECEGQTLLECYRKVLASSR